VLEDVPIAVVGVLALVVGALGGEVVVDDRADGPRTV
jgi:hypothetical protein